MKLKIDPDHPLAQGLIGCWVPGIMHGIDLTGNSPDLIEDAGAVGNFWSGKGSEGPSYGRDTPSSTDSPILGAVAPALYKSWTELSFYYRGDRNGVSSTTTNVPYLVGISYESGITSPYFIAMLGCSAVGDVSDVAGLWNHAGSFQTGTTNNFNQAGTLSALATFKVDSSVVVYKNGAVVSTDAWTGGAPTSTANSRINLNGWSGSSPIRNSPTLCYIACIWNRELTASEAATLDADPYGFLLPDEGEWPAAFSGAAAAALYELINW